MQDILPYLGVEKSFGPEDLAGKEIVLEDYSGLTAADAERKLKITGLRCRLIGTGETVTSQIPASGQTVPGNSEVLLYLNEDTAERLVAVPDFSGMHRQQAAQAAGELGLYLLVSGNTELSPQVVATAQSIPKDTQVPVGTTITLEFTHKLLRD